MGAFGEISPAGILYDAAGASPGNIVWSGSSISSDLAFAIAAGKLANALHKMLWGTVSTSVITAEVAVNSTTYTEQASGAQRSVSSANAADTAAGTGARTVRLTYYTLVAGVIAGPFTENITLNGVTPVNTVATDIALIEDLEVRTAGTGGTNAGVISLFAAAAGAGGTVASIAVFAASSAGRRLNYAQHYVASGRTAFIYEANHFSMSASAQEPNFTLKSLDYSLAAAAEKNLTPFMQVQGVSSTKQFNFSVPIPVVGPARIRSYVSPSTATVAIQGSAFSLIEVPT
jgi:hypothetical protein